MKILVDMNLSPRWTDFLADNGFDALHWSSVGDARAADVDIMAWARTERRVVFTHDLDFGILLALTASAGPSVVQIRALDIVPEVVGTRVVEVLRAFARELDEGSIVTIDGGTTRARVLPIRRKP